MAITNKLHVELARPKGKLVKLGPTQRMDKAGLYVQAHYKGRHSTYGVVCYTRHTNNGDTYWTFSQPYSAAGR